MRVVLVSGGVISGVGKGIIASSAGLLLQTAGLHVTTIKIDPYLNVDAGTLRPLEHGECFVLADGGESDLDLGNYERYLNIKLTRDNNITTGKIYQLVIEQERSGKFLGQTVQVVPHITDAIQDWVTRVAKIPVDDSGEVPDVCIIELGGTVGDIESGPFIEALVQLRHKLTKRKEPNSSFFNIHVTYVPVVHGEEKTKPTQHAIKQMRSAGMTPDLIVCRCDNKLKGATIEKISHYCQVDHEQVIGVHDMDTVYQVPVLLHDQGLLQLLQEGLGLDRLQLAPSARRKGAGLWDLWKRTIDVPKELPLLEIVLVGKYTEHMDSYTSVVKALEHAAMQCKRKLNLTPVNSAHLEDAMLQKSAHVEDDVLQKNVIKYDHAWTSVRRAQGILVPGGFDERGTEGMIQAAKFARERKISYLGICLGLQIAVIEAARNLCGHTNATSEEFKDGAKVEDMAVIFMPEGSKEQMGGTMRLGTRRTHFEPGSEWSKLRSLYGGAAVVKERHRHRYEVNPDYVRDLETAGLCFIGKDDSGRRMEAFELKDHPFYVGLQAHPEFTSKVTACSPPFLGFVASSAGILEAIIQDMDDKRRRAENEGNTT